MTSNLVLYISKAAQGKSHAQLAMQLSQIFRVSKAKNSRAGVSGVITYSNGHYFQVIEGDPQSLQPLYKKILEDDRHSDVQKILDVETTERYFSDFSMRLVSSTFPAKTLEGMGRLLRDHQCSIEPKHQALLNQFSFRVAESEFDAFKGKSIKLTRWPEFSMIQDVPFGIDMSAALVASSHNYDELISSGEFGSQREAEAVVEILKSTDLLMVTGGTVSKATKRSSSSSFYNKMKKFLGRG